MKFNPAISLTIITTNIFFFISFAVVADTSALPATINQLCTEENTTAGKVNSLMFNDCIDRNIKGVRELKYLQNEFGKQFWFSNIAGPNCSGQYSKRGLPDFFLINDCVKREKDKFLNVQYAISKKTQDIDFIRYCFISNFESKNIFLMTDNCVQRGPEKESSYKQILTQVTAKDWRIDVDSLFAGKATGPTGWNSQTMIKLPDVADEAAKKVASSTLAQSPSFFESAKQWFTSKTSDSKPKCDPDKAAASFLAMCSAERIYNAQGSGRNSETAEEREQCRCVAKKFNVEIFVQPPSCQFTSFEQIRQIMKSNKVYTQCL